MYAKVHNYVLHDAVRCWKCRDALSFLKLVQKHSIPLGFATDTHVELQAKRHNKTL